jgi:hypothetical protein
VDLSVLSDQELLDYYNRLVNDIKHNENILWSGIDSEAKRDIRDILNRLYNAKGFAVQEITRREIQYYLI